MKKFVLVLKNVHKQSSIAEALDKFEDFITGRKRSIGMNTEYIDRIIPIDTGRKNIKKVNRNI